jgi:Ca2+-binding EF-hand superfamily protein|uniref:EF-hand domain-containing protein n=1 Tax=Ostreococcus mediterraneus TaxID=1486918 RepID=A0A7S0PL78_9CHLO|mmetsp:Transcript_4868/g.17662  ORF Transcript_4868/g.17662 Transcript_4868/m.17662 type:complete len:179 (+) Transcript_4868:66-602(+)
MPYEYTYQNDYELIQSFNAADADGSGSIEAKELQRALAASGLVFSLQTVALLMRMHAVPGGDETRLSFEQYKTVHQFLVNAQNSFSHFDKSRTGKLSRDEIFEALAYQGYGDVDATAIKHACRAFDPDRSNDLSVDQYIGLSLFLTAARRVFQSFDAKKSGSVTMDFNQFVYATSKTR